MVINDVVFGFIIVVLSFLFLNYIRKIIFFKIFNILPGPKSLPFIGTYHIFLSHDELLDVVLKMTEDYPSPFQVWLGSSLFIGIYEKEDARTILHSRNCIDKSIIYKFFPLFGTGIITAPASIWTQIRTITAPTFGSHMVRNFFNIFVKQSIIFTNTLETIVNSTLEDNLSGNKIVLLKHISICSWTMACDSLMGIQLEPNKSNQYIEALQRIKNIISYRTRNIFLFSNIIFNLTALGHGQKEDSNLIHSFIDEMIWQRVHELNNLNAINENNGTQRTFLDILMEAFRKKDFTLEEIHDNVLSILLAASDTIATTIDFVIFMLANFPKIQEKVYKELWEIYDMDTVKSVPIKYDDLQYMHYLDRVIKETMRLFPPVPIIGRQVTNDLKIGKVTLPKGTDVIICIIKMHRSEKYWPNPLMFDPDRFLPENIKNCQSSCYMPFSNGPRNCLGIKYAMMSMKVILATLIRTFIFKVDKSIEINEIKLKFNTTLSTVDPLKVKIEKRYG